MLVHFILLFNTIRPRAHLANSRRDLTKSEDDEVSNTQNSLKKLQINPSRTSCSDYYRTIPEEKTQSKVIKGKGYKAIIKKEDKTEDLYNSEKNKTGTHTVSEIRVIKISTDE
ncbi:hypothetical protein CDIK_0450 [Cucumispora dikerogammari]|nr:hypothetical protein CDIK_0450 [Cucumispora dikerogammari]